MNVKPGDLARVILPARRNLGKTCFVLGSGEVGRDGWEWEVELLQPAYVSVEKHYIRREAGFICVCADKLLRRIDPPLDKSFLFPIERPVELVS